MKNSALLNVLNKTKLGGNKQQNGSKNWIHSPDALQSNHVVYLVKFLGCTEVDQPKGTDVIREGIRKLKFNQQLKKAEGAKPTKVELTISVDGVTIQEPKSKKVMHKYPLHRISYCADDKLEKRFFSFIAKEVEEGKHMCFVFVSDKLAEEITLTIGQAFDLAYRRFLDNQGKDLEARKLALLSEKRAKMAEAEILELKSRLRDLAALVPAQDLEKFLRQKQISDVLELNIPEENLKNMQNGDDGDSRNVINLISDFDLPSLSRGESEDGQESPPPVPPRTNAAPSPTTGDLLGEIDSSFEGAPPAINGPSIENLNWRELEEFESPPAKPTVAAAPSSVTLTNGHTPTVKLTPPPGKTSQNPPPLPARQQQHAASTNDLLSNIFSSAHSTLPHSSSSSCMSGSSSSVSPLSSGSGASLFASPAINGNTSMPATNGNNTSNNNNAGMRNPFAGFGATGQPGSGDPFGMGEFAGNEAARPNFTGFGDGKQDGFSRGLIQPPNFTEFSLESLDPLRN